MFTECVLGRALVIQSHRPRNPLSHRGGARLAWDESHKA
jgi:hypothetical protein